MGDKLPATRSSSELKKQKMINSSAIYINDEVASNIFRREGIESGYTYNIGYDQLTLTLEQNADERAASQIKHLDEYDRLVYDAVCTLYTQLSVEVMENRIKKRKQLEEKQCSPEEIESILNLPQFKNPMFTAKNVYQIMIGDPHFQHPSDDTLTKIEESLDSLCSMRVDISLFSKKSKDKTSSHSNNILFLGKHIEKTKVPDNNNPGQTKEVNVVYYIIYEMPVLYDYASNNNMLSMVPTEKVKSSSIKMSRMNIALVSKLRNLILNGGTRVIISFEELYEYFREDDLSESAFAKRKQRIREAVFSVLDDWKSSQFIDEWEILEYGKRKLPLTILVVNSHNYRYENMIAQFQSLESQK